MKRKTRVKGWRFWGRGENRQDFSDLLFPIFLSAIFLSAEIRQENGRQENGGRENGRQENGRQENGGRETGRQETGRQENGAINPFCSLLIVVERARPEILGQVIDQRILLRVGHSRAPSNHLLDFARPALARQSLVHDHVCFVANDASLARKLIAFIIGRPPRRR